MSILENLIKIKQKIPSQVRLVAVSKTKSLEAIQEVYQTGILDFAENKVQELLPKYEALPKDIQWHFIGHLQTNKVKFIIPFVATIQSVDSFKLLKEINKEAGKQLRSVVCFLQVHIAKEETKFGFSREELVDLLANEEFKNLGNIKIGGLMGMATYTSDEDLIKSEFMELKQLFLELKSNFFNSNPEFKELSMGMSSDYELAISCGSTMVRVGSSIFGERSNLK